MENRSAEILRMIEEEIGPVTPKIDSSTSEEADKLSADLSYLTKIQKSLSTSNEAFADRFRDFLSHYVDRAVFSNEIIKQELAKLSTSGAPNMPPQATVTAAREVVSELLRADVDWPALLADADGPQKTLTELEERLMPTIAILQQVKPPTSSHQPPSPTSSNEPPPRSVRLGVDAGNDSWWSKLKNRLS